MKNQKFTLTVMLDLRGLKQLMQSGIEIDLLETLSGKIPKEEMNSLIEKMVARATRNIDMFTCTAEDRN